MRGNVWIHRDVQGEKGFRTGGTGMGIPSISIYVTELIDQYGAKKLIRIGSCGSINPEINLRDIIIAMSASTDSSFNKLRFNGMDYASTRGLRTP